MAEQSIGKVVIVYGTVKAQSADGIERVLGPNSPIFLNDRINTGPDGAISIVFSDPANTQLDLGRMTDMVIDNSVIGAEEVNLEEVTAEVEAIQQALESGEEIDIAETAAGPAAGGAGDGGGGRPIYRDELDGELGEITSGAETQGVDYDFTGVLLDPVAEPEQPLVFIPTPEPQVEPVFFQTIEQTATATTLPPTTPPPTPPPSTPPPEEPEALASRVVEEEALPGDDSSEELPSGLIDWINNNPGALPGLSAGLSSGNQDDNDSPPGPDQGTFPDQPAQPNSNFITGNLATDGENDITGGTWSIISNIGPNVFSQGENVEYSLFEQPGADILVAYADSGERPVFLLYLEESGQYAFVLIDQLDHVDGGDENFALITSADGSTSIDFLDFSANIQVEITGNTFPAESFWVYVEDDIPVAAVDAEGISVTLDESGLSLGTTDLSLGNPDNAADADRISDNDSGSGATSVATLFSIGADEDDGDGTAQVSYGFVDDVSGLNALNLSSKGEAVTWSTSVDGQTLTATAGGRTVLTVEIEAATGAWSADLDDQFDHVVPVSGAVENTDLQGTGAPGSIDLTNYLSATDYDGDTYTLEGSDLFTLTIVDDIPVASIEDNLEASVSATVYEDGLRLEGEPDNSEGNDQNVLGDTADETDESAGGNLLSLFTSSFAVGADEEGVAQSLTVGLQEATGPSLFVKGEAVQYSVVGNTLTASTSHGTTFVLTVNSDGTWTFDLDDQLDHVAGDGENTALRTSADGTTSTPGIDLSAFLVGTLTGADEDGDAVSLTSGVGDGSFVITVVDDVPVIGVPQDAAMANETGNSVTGSLNILGSGADETISISLDLTEGDEVLTVEGAPPFFTSDSQTLYWFQNSDGSWTAATADYDEVLGTGIKGFTVSIDEENGTYTVFQDNGVDGGTTTQTISFSDSIGGGNDDEALFGPGPSLAVGETAVYSGSIYLFARGQGDLTDDFGWDGSSDTWGANFLSVNYSNSGIGVGSGQGGAFINEQGAGESEILSLKFYTSVEAFRDTNKSIQVVEGTDTELAEMTEASITVAHLGFEEELTYSLWRNNEQVSDELTWPGDPTTATGNDSAATEVQVQLSAADLNSGDYFDEVRFEAPTGAYRITEVEIEQTLDGIDQTVKIPFEVVDADGDIVSSDFSVTFDGNGDIDAALADAADGDVSTSGMVISGSSGNDVITGTAYDDTIYGGDGSDTIDGAGGNDFIVGEIGDDIIDGGPGDDILIGGEGSDDLDGGADNDILVGDVVDFGAPGVDDTVIIEDNATDNIDGNTDHINGSDADDIAVDPDPATSEDTIADADVVEAGDPDDPLLILVPPPEDAS